ncbi:MAG: hypothetical protein IPP07_28450 [Holophagales bacterium]|nr:hypothetical protein [Holophagales bacterium]
MIEGLRENDPPMHAAFLRDLRRVAGENQLVRESGRFPLCARGRINTYSLFAEHNRAITSLSGRAAFIVPGGIAMDDTTKEFFQAIVSSGSLASLYHFENEDRVFPGIHHASRFVLLTIDRSGRAGIADLVFYARQVGDLDETNRHVALRPMDFELLNPNSRTCPTFRSRRDADINLAMYARAGVLWRDNQLDGNPWNLRFMQGLFNMASDSRLFRTRSEVEAGGCGLIGNRLAGDAGTFIPLIESKMVHYYDHRFGTYAGQTEAQENQGKLPELDDSAHADPLAVVLPYYWVSEAEVEAAISERWKYGWFLGWRDICRSTDQRTLIASLIPKAAVGHPFPLAMPSVDIRLVPALYANLCSYGLDYAARQKVGGTHVNYNVFKQLPVLAPSGYAAPTPWCPASPLVSWLLPRVLELTYTAWDLEAFARDVGWNGPPFRWKPARRFLLRAELDAAFFHLYGISHDDTDYILDTFPIVRKNDEKAHGEYRTKRVILEVYDAMAESIRTDQPYQTRLDPPPADPRVAHPDTRRGPSCPEGLASPESTPDGTTRP